jgi:iron complex outermembrane receptor protein
MFLRSGILFFVVHITCALQAQQDSVLLKPVIVYGIPDEKYLAGSTVEKIDTAIRNTYSSNHLGEILSFQFPIYFRNYGNGMLSGISMRGTSPNHTAVLWNGININSFSLGQADFSILPAVAFDAIKVHTGGGSARFGSGAFGGAILLETGSEENPLLEMKLEGGSFGRYFGSVKASITNKKVIASTSLYRLQADNDFPLRKGGRQQHAAFWQQGFVQHIQYDISPEKSVKVDYWFHDSDRDLQSSVGSQIDTDEQQDRNHRLSVTYQQNNHFGLLKAGAGLVDDKIVFNNIPSNIFRWIGFAKYQYTFANIWNIQTGVDWNHIVGKVEEYGHRREEDRVDLLASVQRDFKRVRMSFNLRQPFITGIHAPLLPYAGAEIILVQEQKNDLTFLINASKNFRAPTLNDRYWQNAGRKDLSPETSYAAESGLSWRHQKLTVKGSAFYQLVDQWIQWIPDAGGTFRPDNVMQVKVRGIESSAELNWRNGKFSQHIKGSYQYTRSTTEKGNRSQQSSIGKQLIYVPLHTVSAFFVNRRGAWSANIFLQYTSKRFTEATNAPGYDLRSFALVDFSVERSFVASRNNFCVRAAVKNIFDSDYQLYSSRAMPGRNFNLQVSYLLKHKTQ